MLATALFSVMLTTPAASTLMVVDGPELDEETAGLIERAAKRAATRRRGKWVEAPKVPLVDVQAMLGCATFDAKCAGSLAKLVKADRTLWVQAKPYEGGAELTLTVVNKKGSVRTKAGPYVLRGKMFKDHLGDVVSSTLRGKPMGHVLIESEPSGARVKVDDSPLGETPLMLTGEWRALELEVSMDGFVIDKRKLSVPKRKTTRVTAKLKAIPTVVEPVPDPVVEPPPDPIESKKDPPVEDAPPNPLTTEPVGLSVEDNPPPGEEPTEPAPSEGLGVLPGVIVGAGAVALATAGGIYGFYFALAAEIDERNRAAHAPFNYQDPVAQTAEDNRADEAYRAAFNEEHKDIRGLLYTSWVAAAVGTTVVLAGAGLMLFE